jgi:hypothetical protein
MLQVDSTQGIENINNLEPKFFCDFRNDHGELVVYNSLVHLVGEGRIERGRYHQIHFGLGGQGKDLADHVVVVLNKRITLEN